jgi:hypothetical protein
MPAQSPQTSFLNFGDLGNRGNFGNSVCGYFFFFFAGDGASGCAPVTLAST